MIICFLKHKYQYLFELNPTQPKLKCRYNSIKLLWFGLVGFLNHYCGKDVRSCDLRFNPEGFFMLQLLWSFCSSQLEEGETKAFKLTHAIPGASKSLEYDTQMTFEESGLANSMISVTWD